MTDLSTPAIGLLLVLVWTGLASVVLFKHALVPAATRFWRSHPPLERILALFFLIAIVCIGGRTPKEPPTSRSRALETTPTPLTHPRVIPSTEPALFQPPASATIADWCRYGAHDDCFLLGTNVIFSQGEAWLDRTKYIPFAASLGIVPEANWHRLLTPNSLFWHDTTSYGSRRFTWHNVLYQRDILQPLSFQLELFDSGDFVYRYNLHSVQPSNVTIAVEFNNQRIPWTAPFPSSQFELHWTAAAPEDTDPDPDGDGIPTATEILQTHTNPRAADSDLDGVSDLDELLAGTQPLLPEGQSLAHTNVFCVTVSVTNPPTAAVALRIADQFATFSPETDATNTAHFWLPEGIALPVSLFASDNTSISLHASLWPASAVWIDPISAFAAPEFLPAAHILRSGFVALPALSADPLHLCYHTQDAIHTTLTVTPALDGSWSWWTDDAPLSGSSSSVTLPYHESQRPTELCALFHATGAQEPRFFRTPITTCRRRLEDAAIPPPDSDAPFVHVTYGEQHLSGPRPDPQQPLHTLVPVNNDDDNASLSPDYADAMPLAQPDDDLVCFYPFGRADGKCCPCPEHAAPFEGSARLLCAPSALALYTDATKTNAFTIGDTLPPGSPLYAEGHSPSTEFAEPILTWEATNSTHGIVLYTNAFTVLSHRFVPDLTSDGLVDAADRALVPSLSPEHGWLMLASSPDLHPVQLVNSVELPGTHTLSLSGEGFRLWQCPHPTTNDAPLLVSGQTLTNEFERSTTLYVAPPTNSATATLTYAFTDGTISCTNSLRITALALDLQLWARDPDTEEETDCSTLVNTSHPVPEASLEVLDAYIDDTGNLNVALTGMIRDRLSEVTWHPPAFHASLTYGNESIAPIELVHSTPEDVRWQYSSSETTFYEEVLLPNIQPGLHLFSLTTDENRAGEIGRAFAYVLVGEAQDEPSSHAPDIPLTLAFPCAPTTNTLDTAFATLGTNSFPLAESSATNTIPDLRFEDTNFRFVATAPLSYFQPERPDTFLAAIEYVSDSTTTNLLHATFTETSPTSLVFTATALPDPDPAPHPVILDTGILDGTPTGFIEPFVAKVVAPDLPTNTAPSQLLQDLGLSVRFHDMEGAFDLVDFDDETFLAAPCESQPYVLTALDNTPADIPADMWDAGLLSLDLVTSNGIVIATFDTWITDPDCGETSGIAPPLRAPARARPNQTAWTVDEAWLMFDLLFGETGIQLHERYIGFGGTVVKAETYGWTLHNYVRYNFSDFATDLPVIVLDEDIPNEVQAALALFDAIKVTRSRWIRYDYHGYVAQEIIESFGTDPDALDTYEQFWREGYANLGDTVAAIQCALEMGVSFLPGNGDIIIDFSHAVEDYREHKYGAMVFGLVTHIGDFSSARKTLQAVDIVRLGRSLGLADEVAEFVVKAAAKTKRAERIEILRPMIQNGTISPDIVRKLYDNGFLKPSSNPYRTLQQFIENGTDAFPGTGAPYIQGKTIRHHDFPRQFELEFLQAGYDPDTVGRALSGEFHKGLHRGKGWGRGGAWNYQWDRFFHSQNTEDLYRFDEADPYGSIKQFLDILRQVDPKIGNWPYIPKGISP